jgi:hypothetical protein
MVLLMSVDMLKLQKQLINSNDSTPKTPATYSSDLVIVPVSSLVTIPPERPIDLPIALRKDKRSTANPHPIIIF